MSAGEKGGVSKVHPSPSRPPLPPPLCRRTYLAWQEAPGGKQAPSMVVADLDAHVACRGAGGGVWEGRHCPCRGVGGWGLDGMGQLWDALVGDSEKQTTRRGPCPLRVVFMRDARDSFTAPAPPRPPPSHSTLLAPPPRPVGVAGLHTPSLHPDKRGKAHTPLFVQPETRLVLRGLGTHSPTHTHTVPQLGPTRTSSPWWWTTTAPARAGPVGTGLEDHHTRHGQQEPEPRQGVAATTQRRRRPPP